MKNPPIRPGPERADRSSVSSGRISELDALRGVAAAMVMLFHYTTMFERHFGRPEPIAFHVGFGHYGVHLFFILSGFVICMTLERNPGGWNFVVSRASRLYPVYWVAVVLTFAAVSVFGLSGMERTPLELVANLTMVQEFLGGRHVTGVSWTLSIELAFYVWMFAFARAGLLARPLRMLLVWLAVNALVIGVMAALELPVPGPMRVALLMEYGNLFLAGIGFYQLRRDHSRSGLALVAVAAPLTSLMRPGDLLADSIMLVAFGLVASGRLRWIAVQPLRYLGAISYPLYLVHGYVGYIVIHQLYDMGFHSTLVVVGVPILVAIALSVLLHHLIEDPAMRLVRARLARPRRSSATTKHETADDQPARVLRAG